METHKRGPKPGSTSPVAPISKARAGVLDRLRAAHGPLGVEELAAKSGQHVNTVREHLDALQVAGLATRTKASRAGRGRPATLYAAARHDPAPASYAALVAALANHITATSDEPAAAAESAGRQWAQSLIPPAPSDAGRPAGAPIPPESVQLKARLGVAATLRESGFGVVGNADATELTVTTCPILAAARKNPDVVCTVHLGLAKGLLEGRGVPSEDATLEPFAVPGGCRLSLPVAGPGQRALVGQKLDGGLGVGHDSGMEKLIPSAAAVAAFDALAADVENAGVTVGKMFGATSLMAGSKAIGCLHGDGIAFKLGRESAGHAAALALPGAALFDPSGMNRPFKDWVVVPLGSAPQWPELADAALAALAG